MSCKCKQQICSQLFWYMLPSKNTIINMTTILKAAGECAFLNNMMLACKCSILLLIPNHPTTQPPKNSIKLFNLIKVSIQWLSFLTLELWTRLDNEVEMIKISSGIPMINSFNIVSKLTITFGLSERALS